MSDFMEESCEPGRMESVLIFTEKLSETGGRIARPSGLRGEEVSVRQSADKHPPERICLSGGWRLFGCSPWAGAYSTREGAV